MTSIRLPSLLLVLPLLGACQTTQTNTARPPALLPVPVTAPSLEPAIALSRTTIVKSLSQGDAAASRAHSLTLATTQARTQITQALSHTSWRIGSAWVGQAPPQDQWRTHLERWRSPTQARSVGTTSQGTLIGAKQIALQGPHHEVITRAKSRKTNWGHPATVKTLTYSAERVAKQFPGSKLALGNLSKKKGGDLYWSVSHNSGRDADIAFYVTSISSGSALPTAPDLLEFDDQGISVNFPDLLFDVPRNWALAKALLTSPHADVQFLFISQPLKDLLLAHAIENKEPESILQRARLAMKQPEDALPHNDHFHLRIRCPKDDRLNGCVDRGPRWQWLDWHEDALLERTVAMIPAMTSGDEKTKLATLDYLQAIESPYNAEFALTFGLQDKSPKVRGRALEVASSLFSFTGAGVLAMQHAITLPTNTPKTKARLYALMRKSLDPWIIPFIQSRIEDPTLSHKERSQATWALAHQMDQSLVPYLLDRLEKEPSSQVRATLGDVLRRVANRQELVNWAASPKATRALALSRWRQWWEIHKVEPRQVWVARGLQIVDKEITAENLGEGYSIELLIQALPAAPDHLMYNINRTLRQSTGRWSPLEQRNGTKLYERWSKWWETHRERWLVAKN